MNKNILLISNDYFFQDNIINYLNLYGWKVVIAQTGEEGFKKAIQEKPNVILCDSLLADLDSHQVLEEIRSNIETQAIPFIFLTDSNQNSHDYYRFIMELGADDYLVKPVSNEMIFKSIESRIKRKFYLEKNLKREIDKTKKQLKLKNEKEKIQEEVWDNLLINIRNQLNKIKLAIKLLNSSTFESKKQIYAMILQEECATLNELVNNANELRVLLTPDHLDLFQYYAKK